MRMGASAKFLTRGGPSRTWAVSDERVGIRGGRIFWSYNIGQLHLGKQIYIGNIFVL